MKERRSGLKALGWSSRLGESPPVGSKYGSREHNLLYLTGKSSRNAARLKKDYVVELFIK